MISALQRAITQPATFFDREAREPGLRRPAAVVAVVALVGTLSTIPVLRATFSALPSGANAFVAVGIAVGAVAGLLGPFVVWLAYTALFYLLSLVFDGSGEFRNLFAVVGWGFAPRVLSALAGAVVLSVAVSGVDFSDPAQVQQFRRSFRTSPLGIVNRVIGLLVTLWSAWIWTHAVANARNLTTRQAGIVVGSVVGLGILAGFAGTVLA